MCRVQLHDILPWLADAAGNPLRHLLEYCIPYVYVELVYAESVITSPSPDKRAHFGYKCNSDTSMKVWYEQPSAMVSSGGFLSRPWAASQSCCQEDMCEVFFRSDGQ